MKAEEFLEELAKNLDQRVFRTVDKVYCEASVVQEFAEHQSIEFAKFIGERPIPEYSKSTDKWRWWDNNRWEYKYATTNELLTEWLKIKKT